MANLKTIGRDAGRLNFSLLSRTPDHQLIEYGPVNFRNKSLQLWLPKSADWYCSISGRRFHRRHTFSQFLLFSVDDKQKISAPPEPVAAQPRENQDFGA
jgi:hypothetical protein